MARRDIIVIGASAGGVHALVSLVKSLRQDFNGHIFIVMHMPPFSKTYLTNILSRANDLLAVHPSDGDLIEPGKIYIAPPDHHMLLEKEHILVKRGPKENRFRPSIDALFRSAAYQYGPRVIGVVLSGMLDDGTSGMWTIKRFGGTTIIQDPADAMHSGMPESVIQFVDIDHQLPVIEIGPLLGNLCTTKTVRKVKLSKEENFRIQTEIAIAAEKHSFDTGFLRAGKLTMLSCPECSGALVVINEGKMNRYRCNTGHSFGLDALLSGVMKSVEGDLWKAVKGLEESILLFEEMGKRQEDIGDHNAARKSIEKANENRKRVHILHDTIFQYGGPSRQEEHT